MADVHYNSYAGTDIQCFFFDVTNPADVLSTLDNDGNITDEEYNSLKEKIGSSFKVNAFGELQTLSISIASSFGPVRRLGEKEVVQYKGGARTVAGTLVFALLNRDIFSTHMKSQIAGAKQSKWHSPNYVDEIPEFNILIQGGNEFGSFASGMLIGVKLTNFGTTFSVDDLYTESTYTYVARHYIPFTDDWRNSLYEQFINQIKDSPLSSATITDNVLMQHNNQLIPINRRLFEWYSSLPPAAQSRIKQHLPLIEQTIIKKYK